MKSLRMFLTIAILIAFVIGGGGGLWWLFLRSFTERQITDVIARAEAEGITVTYKTMTGDGFPDFVAWTLRDVRIAAKTDEGEVKGRLNYIKILVRPWEPNKMRIESRDPQRWQWFPADPDAPSRDYRIASMFGAIGPREEAAGWQVTFNLENVKGVAGDTAQPLLAESIGLEAETPFSRREAAFKLRLDRVQLPEETLLGSLITLAMAEGDLKPLPKGWRAEHLDDWRQAGGELIIRESEVAFGAMEAQANGQLSVDHALRPAGMLNLSVKQPDALLRLAIQQNLIAADHAPLIQMGAGMLTKQTAAGGQVLEAPLEFRDGAAWLGPLRLFPVKPLAANAGP